MPPGKHLRKPVCSEYIRRHSFQSPAVFGECGYPDSVALPPVEESG
ncbi:hypothetical protein Pcinc_044200, partial [Petrolisthes cinctipes]